MVGHSSNQCGSERVPRILAMGVFDLFHVGHLRYLQYALRQGNHLSVALAPDALCLELKGRVPVIPQDQRLEIIRGLGWVDFAGLLPCRMDWTDQAAQWITDWGIDHVVAGGEWQGAPRWRRLALVLADRGIEVSFAPHLPGISTTQIVRSIVGRGGSVE